MRYISTRGSAPALDFEGALLTGLAPDGGLYVPESMPVLDIDPSWSRLSYAETVVRVAAPFTSGVFDDDQLGTLASDAYSRFRHGDVAPLSSFDGLTMLELFWGPTLSFKDYALQLVGRLLDEVLIRRGERVTVVGATSGDTGSAAIEALRERDAVDVVILHPRGRVSDIQRRQMTTVDARNVHNVAIEGTFDDCQDLVKAMFADAQFRATVRPAAVNSINWGRIMAQAAYYVWAALRIGPADAAVDFVVPTGNFGNVYAGHVARALGAPIGKLVVANNANHGLATFLETGRLPIGPVQHTLAPAMDIQVPSNLERLLFELLERNRAALSGLMIDARLNGELALLPVQLAPIKDAFGASWSSDEEILETIGAVYRDANLLIDPHTATAVAASRDYGAGPRVIVSTAHPAKFPEAVERATGVVPELPDDLADLLERPERFEVLPNDLQVVMDHIRGLH